MTSERQGGRARPFAALRFAGPPLTGKGARGAEHESEEMSGAGNSSPRCWGSAAGAGLEGAASSSGRAFDAGDGQAVLASAVTSSGSSCRCRRAVERPPWRALAGAGIRAGCWPARPGRGGCLPHGQIGGVCRGRPWRRRSAASYRLWFLRTQPRSRAASCTTCRGGPALG